MPSEKPPERRRAASSRSTSSSISSAREARDAALGREYAEVVASRTRRMRGGLEHDADLGERVAELGVREAVDGGRPGGGRDQADERAQGGRLARSVGTEEPDHLPLVDVEAQVVDGPHGAEVLCQVLNRDDGHVRLIIRVRRPPPRACWPVWRGERTGTLPRTGHMKVTITGASGLIGSKLVERLQARGDEVTTLSRNPSSPQAVRWLPEQEPAPAAGARRPRRRHPPRGRERRPALERRRQAPHPQLARARHPQPRGRHRGRRGAPARARLLLRGRLLRPPRRRACSTRTRRPATTSSPRSA